MEKAKLKNKAIVPQIDEVLPSYHYEYRGAKYDKLRDIPLPLTQAHALLGSKIKVVHDK